MRCFRFSKPALCCLVVCCSLAAADLATPSPGSDWTDLLLDLPVVHWLIPAAAPLPIPVPGAPIGACRVQPLPPITDPDAMEFERSVSPTTTGLVPAMTRALAKFQEMVTSVGGTFELKSAYRPPAYQEHLQQVWYKWMELRNNRVAGCQVLRAEVEAEFTGHHLMESQKPVNSSDHTRGMAFDATVLMPAISRPRKLPVSLDRLAFLCGIVRPDVIRDPVHYKLVIPSAIHPTALSTE